EESEEALLARVGLHARVAVLGHPVIHEGEVAMPDDASGIADLRHVAHAIAAVGRAAVPDLVVEHHHAPGRAETGDDRWLPPRSLNRFRRRRAEQVRAGDRL